jgi:hypothetical protein
MAKGIQDLGNGFGFVYMTAPDGTTIESVVSNTNESVRSFRKNANLVAPLASNRSAFGILTFTTGTAGAGSITAISVNGVDQIAAPFVVTGLTDAACAAAAAVQINVFKPGSGYDYFAVAVGASVYIFAPPSAGATPNGYAIALTDSGSVVTYTSQAFINGADTGGVYDTVSGSRFFLNADYGPNGISGELAAQMDVLDLPNSVEITKYIVMRGQQAGIFNKTITASSYILAGVDRSGIMTKVNVIPQSGSTQTVIKINTEDFQEGDLVFIQADDPGDIITVESAPAITVVGTGNIYLTNDLPFVSNRYTSLLLQYKFITGIGPSFVEMARSLATTNDTELGRTLWVSSLGNDASGERGNLSKHYLTITAAKNAALSGDTIVVCPGTYTEDQLQKNGVNYLFLPGSEVVSTGASIFYFTSESFKIFGSGVFTSNFANAFQGFFCNGNVYLECQAINSGTGACINLYGLPGFKFVANIKGDLTSSSTTQVIVGSGSQDVSITCNDIVTTLNGAGGSYTPNILNTGQITVQQFSGRCSINFNQLRQTNNAGVPSVQAWDNLQQTAYINITGKAAFNSSPGYQVDAIALFESNSIRFNFNLYCYGMSNGVRVDGQETLNESASIFNGNIITEKGQAIYVVSGGLNVIYNGTINAKTENIISEYSPAPPVPAAVSIGATQALASPQKMYLTINGSVNQFYPGSVPIYKAMQPRLVGNELDHGLELQGIKMYSDDGISPCIVTETPVTPVDNTIILQGSYANTAASGGGTYVGTLVVDAAVSSQYFIL